MHNQGPGLQRRGKTQRSTHAYRRRYAHNSRSGSRSCTQRDSFEASLAPAKPPEPSSTAGPRVERIAIRSELIERATLWVDLYLPVDAKREMPPGLPPSLDGKRPSTTETARNLIGENLPIHHRIQQPTANTDRSGLLLTGSGFESSPWRRTAGSRFRGLCRFWGMLESPTVSGQACRVRPLRASEYGACMQLAQRAEEGRTVTVRLPSSAARSSQAHVSPGTRAPRLEGGDPSRGHDRTARHATPRRC